MNLPFEQLFETIISFVDTWTLSIGEEFVCSQELASEHDVHAIAVYGDGDEGLGHHLMQFSRVAFLFLDCCLRSRVNHSALDSMGQTSLVLECLRHSPFRLILTD